MPYITIPGESPLQLYHEDSGGEGRPVVLIHGWPLSAQAWAAQVGPLAEAGYRVVAYDRRGFGRSGRAAGGYEYDTLASDLNEVVTQLDLTGAVLVGHSMGGGEVARHLATQGAGRVAGAVFVSAITPALCQTPDNPDGGMPFDGFADLREQCRGDREGFLRRFMTWFFSNPSELTIDDAQFGEVLRIAAQGSDRALQDCILAWATDFRADLAHVDVPTLVIHGDADNNVPFEASGRRMPQYVAQAEVRVVEGGPHGLPVSHAAEFNAILLEFLAGL